MGKSFLAPQGQRLSLNSFLVSQALSLSLSPFPSLYLGNHFTNFPHYLSSIFCLAKHEERGSPTRNGPFLPDPTIPLESQFPGAVREQVRFASDGRSFHEGVVEADQSFQVHRCLLSVEVPGLSSPSGLQVKGKDEGDA